MKDLLFIYNPNSGQQMIGDYMNWIINYLSSEGYLGSFYATQESGDARKIVEKIGKNFEKIMVSGGDGTLDEVISGAVKANISPEISYVPTGSTNDFAKSLNISSDIKEATQMAVNAKSKLVDVGKIDDKYFVYVAAFGTISEVSFNTDQDLKNIFGRSAYVFEGLRKALPLQTMDSYHAEVFFDDEKIEGDFVHFMVTNSFSVGGFSNILGNNVGLDDGIFELTIIKKPKSLTDLNKIVSALSNKKENDMVILRQASSFRVKTDREVSWSLDGEYGGVSLDARIDILKKRISIKTGLEDWKSLEMWYNIQSTFTKTSK